MGELACHFVSLVSRSAIIWGRVVFATQETSPYDIAVVRLEEDLDGVPVPVPAEHFHEGNEQRYNLEKRGMGKETSWGLRLVRVILLPKDANKGLAQARE